MERYENYDLQDEDPYLIPGSTCLANCLGITDTQTLTKAESEIASVAMAGLIANPVEPTFDLHHLQQIHYRLFSDIYGWAGELRCTEISKGGQLFLPHKLCAKETTAIFSMLHHDQLLQGLDSAAFAERSAFFLGNINKVHPFREGNGRTQRILLDQLAELSGYGFEWAAISGEQMARACRAARAERPDYSELSRILKLYIVRL